MSHAPLAMIRRLVLAALIALSAGCTPAAHEPNAAPPVKRYSAREARDLVVKGEALLVDVRERDEIASGLAEPALWVPTSGNGGFSWQELRDTLGTNGLAIFYCRSGRRSQDAATRLAAEGVSAGNSGGFSEWASAGLPVREPSSARDRW